MFTFIKTSSTVLLFCLLGALLQGCGAERDTPFNPDTSNSSSSLGSNISGVQSLREGTNPTAAYGESKQLIAIRDQEQMNLYWDDYVSDTDWDDDVVDFETGQVLLIDRGNIGNCSRLIDVQNVKAYDHSSNTVKVVIKYTDSGTTSNSSSSSSSSESSSSSSSSFSEPSCTLDPSNPNQPFRFYFIPSRKVMVFQEDIE